MAEPVNMEEQAPRAGDSIEILPNIRRILAPNPSPMTHWGTNTYLLGTTEIAVIDPGPEDQQHLDAILNAVSPKQRITHIFVTHAHLDHSPLAKPLAEKTGAKVYAYGDAIAGRSKSMQDLVKNGLTTGGEGVDHDFAPDITLSDGETIKADGWELRAIWTPGHMANHMCFDANGNIFSGDHVMGWASSLVSPPDGDLAAFMWSCDRLQALKTNVYLPGHGAIVNEPAKRIAWLIKHRKAREASILSALSDAQGSIPDLTRRIYSDIPSALLPAAQRNVFAHLLDLQARSKVTAHPHLSFAATFSLK